MTAIREFRPADFEDLYRIDSACFEREISYSRRELNHYISQRGSLTLVAEDQGKPIGFIIVRREAGRCGHVITIDILPEHRRQGIGSRLMAEAESWLARRGARAVYLETAADNLAAIDFYRKLGYLEAGRISGYYQGRRDALRMAKQLV